MRGLCCWFLVLTFACGRPDSCSNFNVADAGDGGVVDAGVGLKDGGEIQATGGCYNPDEPRKFILYVDGPSLCAAVSFRALDGGIAPLFDDRTTAPESFKIDAARIGLCASPLEQASGQLDPRAAELDDFSARVDWAVFQGGRPYTYSARGTLSAFGTVYWFATPPEGSSLTDRCRGP